MGIVNFDYNKLINGEKDHRIGKFATKLSAVIEDTMIHTADDYELTKLLYHMADSDSAFESAVIEDGIGYMGATLDGNKPKTDKTTFVGSKEWKHIPYSTSIQFTKQYLDDCHYALREQDGAKARQIPSSYYKTRERVAQLGYIEGENETMTFAGATTPLTTYDGKPLFSKTHAFGAANGHANGAQSNLYYVVDADPTSGKIAEYVQQMSIHMRQMKDSNGEAQLYTGDTILIPGNTPKLELCTRQAIGSEFWPSTPNNDMNPQAGRFNFKPLPAWEIGDNDSMDIIMISQEAKENMGSAFWNRESLSVTGEFVMAERVFNFYGHARFSIGHANYRHAIKLKIFKTEPSDKSKYTAL